MKIAFLFSGQGSQYPGMLKDLYKCNSTVKRIMKLADESLERSISKICFEGSQAELDITQNTQPCVLAVDLAVGMALIKAGIVPDAVAGFSLGEYAALAVAGVLPETEVFPLIQVRADAMQQAVPLGDGAMVAVIGMSSIEVEQLCREVKNGYVEPANYNSPLQTVVSGSSEGIHSFISLAKTRKIHTLQLPVSAPFHCELMKPAAERLKKSFENINFQEARIPIYMNYTARPLEKNDVAEFLYKQAYNPVLWKQTLENMQKDGIDTYIECGPGKVLFGLVKKTLKDVKVFHVENMKTLNKTLTAILGHTHETYGGE